MLDGVTEAPMYIRQEALVSSKPVASAPPGRVDLREAALGEVGDLLRGERWREQLVDRQDGYRMVGTSLSMDWFYLHRIV